MSQSTNALPMSDIHVESQSLEATARVLANWVTGMTVLSGAAALLAPHIGSPTAKSCLLVGIAVLLIVMVGVESRARQYMHFARLGRFSVVASFLDPSKNHVAAASWSRFMALLPAKARTVSTTPQNATEFYGVDPNKSGPAGKPLAYSAFFTSRIYTKQLQLQVWVTVALCLGAVGSLAWTLLRQSQSSAISPTIATSVVDAVFGTVLFVLALRSAQVCMALHLAREASLRVYDMACACRESAEAIMLLAYYEIVRSGSPHTSTRVYASMRQELEAQWAVISARLS